MLKLVCFSFWEYLFGHTSRFPDTIDLVFNCISMQAFNVLVCARVFEVAFRLSTE